MDLGIHIVVIDRPRVTINGPQISSVEEFYTLWEEELHGVR